MDKNTPPYFTTTTYGKWILTGEHAVLRGHPAIIFPVRERSLELRYWSSTEEIRAEFSGEYGDELQFLFWSALERSIEILNLAHGELTGNFHLQSNIPIGAGMGASAALCVAVGRWFVMQGYVSTENLHEFARQLENLFHSESSGADIAVSIANEGIYFSRTGGLHPIKPQWQPQWFLSFSEKVSTTSRCVKKVKELWSKDVNLAQLIDQEMAMSVSLAEKALLSSTAQGLPLMTESLQLACSCFQRWGLIENNSQRHMDTLLSAGALAVKPTGAGDGGFILSLWSEPPRVPMGIELIGV